MSWMLKEITVAMVLDTMDEVVAEYGEDYVYNGYDNVGREEGGMNCAYLNSDGTPSCLIGHVLLRLGVPKEQFRTANFCTVGTFAEIAHLPVGHAALYVMRKAQAVQDERGTWGAALLAARDAASKAAEAR